MSMSVKTVEEVSAEVPAEDFQALEEKVYRTIELYKAAKEARATAERDLQRLREQLEEREEENEAMRRELVQLRKDREDIRTRVEKMLSQMDTPDARAGGKLSGNGEMTSRPAVDRPGSDPPRSNMATASKQAASEFTNMATATSAEQTALAPLPKDALLNAANGSVRVEIFDQVYNLRGSDADYILRLAEYVDGKMRAVSQQTATVDSVRLAVLAALNIADEYHLLKRRLEGLRQKRGSGRASWQARWTKFWKIRGARARVGYPPFQHR
jgi:cell division protein ZapA